MLGVPLLGSHARYTLIHQRRPRPGLNLREIDRGGGQTSELGNLAQETVVRKARVANEGKEVDNCQTEDTSSFFTRSEKETDVGTQRGFAQTAIM